METEDALKKTHFVISDLKFGILPGMLIYKLAKYMGIGNANHTVLTSKEIDLKTTFKYGIVNKITNKHEKIPVFIKDNRNQNSPGLVLMARCLLNESFHDSYEEAIGHYLAAQDRCINLLWQEKV